MNPKKQLYTVPVRYTVEGTLDVLAWNPQDALDKAEDMVHGKGIYPQNSTPDAESVEVYEGSIAERRPDIPGAASTRNKSMDECAKQPGPEITVVSEPKDTSGDVSISISGKERASF